MQFKEEHFRKVTETQYKQTGKSWGVFFAITGGPSVCAAFISQTFRNLEKKVALGVLFNPHSFKYLLINNDIFSITNSRLWECKVLK